MKSPTVGQTAWIKPIQGHEVALGWQEGQAVKVISERRNGLCYVTIEKPTGERIEIPHWELDCGREFQGRSRQWVHESDPRVLQYLADLRDKQTLGHECGLMDRYTENLVQGINHVLQRNGWGHNQG